MIIIVTGSVGTGKTTVSKELAKRLRLSYIDVNKVIGQEQLCEAYDADRDCMVIDEKKLAKALVKKIKESDNLIIDSHMSQYIPKKYVDLCIVTQCDLKILEKRLKKRKYSKKKIAENVETEIFDVCLHEAKEKRHHVLVVDTTEEINFKNFAARIKKLIFP